MSHIGKTPLKLPEGFVIELHSHRDGETFPLRWNCSEISYDFPVSTPLRGEKNVIVFTGSGEAFSSEIPEGFLIKVYPKEALKLSNGRTHLQVYGEKGANLLLDLVRCERSIKKGPQRRQEKKQKELWGTTQRSVQTSLDSCKETQTLEISLKGLGYKALITEEKHLQLKLGFSHSVELAVPQNISVNISTEASTSDSQRIILSSYDKRILGNFGNTIRSFRPPEPYKGKGVLWETPRAKNKYLLRRKVGKEGN